MVKSCFNYNIGWKETCTYYHNGHCFAKMGQYNQCMTEQYNLEEFEAFKESSTLEWIYTDASYSPQHHIGSWAMITSRNMTRKGVIPFKTDISYCELYAVEQAIMEAEKYERCNIYTDSQYVVSQLCSKCEHYERVGWYDKEWVKMMSNIQLIKRTYELLKSNPHIQILWVKGHHVDEKNKNVDKIARQTLRNHINRGM